MRPAFKSSAYIATAVVLAWSVYAISSLISGSHRSAEAKTAATNDAQHQASAFAEKVRATLAEGELTERVVLAQALGTGVGVVGATSADGSVTVTFEVNIPYAGSGLWTSSDVVRECYSERIWRSGSTVLDSLGTIPCARLPLAFSPTATPITLP